MDARVRVDWHDGLAKKVAREAAQSALEQAGLSVQHKAQDIVPHEFGDLEGTATVEPLEGDKIGVRISFGGGPAALYAEVQHEDTTLNHPNGRQSKYLETPFKADAPLMPRLVELSVKAALQRGG